MSLLLKLFHFVSLITNKFDIDESHGITHSMNVLNFAHNIYNNEKNKYPEIENHERIIYISAILHDMCDKKYVDETSGVKEIEDFLNEKITQPEIDITKKIITTMSYSTVKKNGFPNLKEYQIAYHIVREADLLSAYDFDRCMIYNIKKQNGNIEDAFINANYLFENRVFKHDDDGLFITDYSKKESLILKNVALTRINNWKNILKNPTLF